jgi:hypothetical protein
MHVSASEVSLAAAAPVIVDRHSLSGQHSRNIEAPQVEKHDHHTAVFKKDPRLMYDQTTNLSDHKQQGRQSI